MEGLEKAGIIITSKVYLERYAEMLQKQEDNYYREIRKYMNESLIRAVMEMYGNPLTLCAQPIITEEDLKMSEEADIAVYVVSRTFGEGADRKLKEGDYYLSKEEKENLKILSEKFRNLVILLNMGSQIDTEYIRKLPNLSALVFVGQAAGVTGLAVADVVTGKVTPEGKFTDTWAKKYDDYPNGDNYGVMNGNLDDEYYTEGIYVGYRYFDSFGIQPAYPFGYGMSYTDFIIGIEDVFKENGKLIINVNVENTGNIYAGRETVQVYISAPQGELEKPYQELKGFQKTRLLEPGETQKVVIEIEFKSFASYNEKKNAWVMETGDYIIRVGNSSRNTVIVGVMKIEKEIVCEQCRNLCRGNQKLPEIFAKSSVKISMKIPFYLEDTTYETNNAFIRKKELKIVHVCEKDIIYMCNAYRIRPYSGYEHQRRIKKLHSKKSRLKKLQPQNLQSNLQEKKKKSSDEITNTEKLLQFQDVITGYLSLDDFVSSLTVEEMCYLCVGNAGEGEATFVTYGSINTKIEAVVPMAPGTCDSTRMLIESRGIPNMHMSDGSSGLRVLPQFEVDKEGNLLTEGVILVRNVDKIIGEDYIKDRVNHEVYEQYMTGLPIATMLAQTWDRDCWRKCGEIEGKEMQMSHVELWLAPSMNIHRNPLCGRNFEYYSEDPLITGECATAVTRAIQKFRCAGVTLKHFACNNQEDNRYATNVHISERALREIYLKGFEIAVRLAHPAAVMTSYNLINGVHTANDYDLLTSILRDEWGFDGMVMTDWGITSSDDNEKRKYKASTCCGCICAGNDLIMPGAKSDIEALYQSVQNGEITSEELKTSSRRILKTMLWLEAGRI